MSDNKALADRLRKMADECESSEDGDTGLPGTFLKQCSGFVHDDLTEAARIIASPQADKARGEVVAIRNELEALAERWYASVQGKPGSRRIATIDESNPALAMRGEDDFDNEAFAYRRCAREVEKIARRLSTTPQPQGDATPQARPDATFAEWLATEMPPGTVIGDPAWWANRIARQYAVRCTQARPDGGAVAKVRRDTGLTITADRLPYYSGQRVPPGTELFTHPTPAPDAVGRLVEEYTPYFQDGHLPYYVREFWTRLTAAQKEEVTNGQE